MDPDQQIMQPKRPYQKPRLRTIELAAEEVLAVGCKATAGIGGFGNPVSCTAAGCSSPGS